MAEILTLAAARSEREPAVRAARIMQYRGALYRRLGDGGPAAIAVLYAAAAAIGVPWAMAVEDLVVLQTRQRLSQQCAEAAPKLSELTLRRAKILGGIAELQHAAQKLPPDCPLTDDQVSAILNPAARLELEQAILARELRELAQVAQALERLEASNPRLFGAADMTTSAARNIPTSHEV